MKVEEEVKQIEIVAEQAKSISSYENLLSKFLNYVGDETPGKPPFNIVNVRYLSSIHNQQLYLSVPIKRS